MAKTRHVIKPDKTKPEILAASIVEISTGVKQLLNSPLQNRTIFVLVQDAIGKRRTGKPMPLSDIELVLTAAAELDKTCLKPQAKT